MANVKAIRNFHHYGRRRKGEAFVLPDATAIELSHLGLVEVIKGTPQDPGTAAGAQSSASPAAQASPQTKSSTSGAGVKKKARKKRAASSSPTPPSK